VDERFPFTMELGDNGKSVSAVLGGSRIREEIMMNLRALTESTVDAHQLGTSLIWKWIEMEVGKERSDCQRCKGNVQAYEVEVDRGRKN
jgi:hypothetical protein